jgi:hypothetical protein
MLDRGKGGHRGRRTSISPAAAELGELNWGRCGLLGHGALVSLPGWEAHHATSKVLAATAASRALLGVGTRRELRRTCDEPTSRNTVCPSPWARRCRHDSRGRTDCPMHGWKRVQSCRNAGGRRTSVGVLRAGERLCRMSVTSESTAPVFLGGTDECGSAVQERSIAPRSRKHTASGEMF